VTRFRAKIVITKLPRVQAPRTHRTFEGLTPAPARPHRRRFDVTTGKNPEPSGAFNGLRFFKNQPVAILDEAITLLRFKLNVPSGDLNGNNCLADAEAFLNPKPVSNSICMGGLIALHYTSLVRRVTPAASSIASYRRMRDASFA
jgi:hypothetical protein